jgi:hypothetical protein
VKSGNAFFGMAQFDFNGRYVVDIARKLGQARGLALQKAAADANTLGRQKLRITWPHTFFPELFYGIGCFLQRANAHAPENVIRLSELDVVVRDDFDAISPWIENIQPVIDALDAEFVQCPLHRLAVVDDETEMALGIRHLGSTERELDELVAEIDERVVIALAAELEVENRAVKLQRFVQVVDFKDDVIDP